MTYTAYDVHQIARSLLHVEALEASGVSAENSDFRLVVPIAL